MSIKLEVTDKQQCLNVPMTLLNFPAGESLVRLALPQWKSFSDVYVTVTFNYEDDKEIIQLMMLMDALRRKVGKCKHITLVMPYFPYARQDRVCYEGEALSAKVMADIINSLGFDKVVCHDLHSNVSAAVINNLSEVNQTACARGLAVKFDTENTVVVSPDFGATKKTLDFCTVFGFHQFVQAEKRRDVATGQLSGFKVHSDHVGNKDFLIMDDILDGGGTFIGLADELKKLTDGKIYLYVTHCIATKGVEIFDGVIDKIYTANQMCADAQIIESI